MKRILSIITVLMVSAVLHAQNKDVTKFLGIPVDGTKAEMIQKLKAKGFVSSPYNREVLNGEFNGREVNVYVATNNNKVYRIMVADANTCDETEIKIRFNTLYYQFKNNSKYTASTYNQSLSDDEDIYYGINADKKQYAAMFYQKSSLLTPDEQSNDLSFTKRPVWFKINKYSYREYGISIFYDNEYNAANGEDL